MTHFPSVSVLCGDRVEGGGIATCLGRRGTRRAAGQAEGWSRSCAVAVARTRKPRGRHCRRGVCRGEAACCPPCLLASRVLKLSLGNLCSSTWANSEQPKQRVQKLKIIIIIIKMKTESSYSSPVVLEATQGRWLTRSHDKNKENEETTLRQNETSSLSMRQLCPRRRNNRESPTGRNERSQSVNG